MHRHESIRRVCIIFGGALGDLVLLLPSLLAIREEYRDAHMEIIGNPSWLGFLEERGYVDRAYSLEQMPVHILFQSCLPKNHPFLEFLKGFDLVISWFGDREGIFLRNIRSIAQSSAFIFPFQNHEHYAGHVSEYYLSTLKTLGVHVRSPRYRLLPLRSSSSIKGRSQGVANPFDPPLFCIHPGSGTEAKNWPLGYFINVAHEITRELHMQVYFLIGPTEKEKSQDLKMLDGVQSITVLRDLSVSALATLLERSSVYLGNDSGPTHLAASTGTPTVAIFGPTSKGKWSPRGPTVHVVQHTIPCCPCDNRVMRSCSARRCLVEITPDRVVEAILSLLSFLKNQ